MKNKSTIIRSPLATMRCFQFLLNFFQFGLAHTGDNIGKLLMDIHTRVECELFFVGSHVFDGAVNSGKSIEVLRLSTIYKRSGMIFSAKFDSRQMNTTGKKASGTSSHKVNLNLELCKSLTLLHTYLARLGGSVTRIKVYDNVRKDSHRKSSPYLTTGIRTRCNSDHLETSRTSDNHSDL